MGVRIRFRNDGWHLAEMRQEGRTPDDLRRWGYDEDTIAHYLNMEPAQPGDTWRVRWHQPEGIGPIAGYAICCPLCKKIHAWTSALYCSPSGPCQHSGKSSCWTWTGSAEEGTLSASPSLYAIKACGWHGFLTNGQLLG